MNNTTSAASPPSPPERTAIWHHPIGFWFFFWGEFAERCCYYGMRAILLLYMIQILKFEDGQANRVMSYFIAACYLLPLIGGYVADNFVGKYRTIVYFSIPYIFGQALLGIASLHNETCLFLSLGLLAMGSGVIKPNISTLMGLTYDQRRPGQIKLRSDAFAMFYGSINIGAALSSFCVPWIRNHYGGDSHAYAVAFLFPAALMTMAFIVFAAGKPFYAAEVIQRKRLSPAERHERFVVLRRLFGLFLVVTVFWSIFDQSASTWTLFARDYLHLSLLGFKLSPDQIQAVNPILIVLMLPPITMLWHLLARMGLNLRPTDKMLIGFGVTTVTMAITAWAAFRGAGTVVAGAPAALTSAEETIAALNDGQQANADAERAVDALLAARTASKAGDAAAAQAGDAVRAAVGKAGTVPTVVIAARRAAEAALRAARAAEAAAATPTAATVKDTIAAAERAEAAADATTEAHKLVVEESRNGDGGSPRPPAADLTFCAVAANRAAATAAAATKAAAAAEAHNTGAAQVNAGVAGLAAADVVLAVAEGIAQLADQPALPAAAKTATVVADGRISVLWQIIPYLLITIAEICISVVGLELAFAAAPQSMKSFVTACWLLTVFFGNILNAQVTPLYNETFLGFSLTPDWYFLGFAVTMVPVSLAFLVISRRFNRLTSAS